MQWLTYFLMGGSNSAGVIVINTAINEGGIASNTLKRLLDQAEDAAKSEDKDVEVTTSNVGLFIIIGLLVLCLVLCIIFCAVRSLLLPSNSH